MYIDWIDLCESQGAHSFKWVRITWWDSAFQLFRGCWLCWKQECTIFVCWCIVIFVLWIFNVALKIRNTVEMSVFGLEFCKKHFGGDSNYNMPESTSKRKLVAPFLSWCRKMACIRNSSNCKIQWSIKCGRLIY